MTTQEERDAKGKAPIKLTGKAAEAWALRKKHLDGLLNGSIPWGTPLPETKTDTELVLSMKQIFAPVLANTKLCLDDLSTRIDSAAAANDTMALERLRAEYKSQETNYNKLCSFVSEIESVRGRPDRVLNILQQYLAYAKNKNKK
ncbi:MAG: hypothetical protein HY438_02375 [DPANN group archaeon]|nr:hypothetical protein [DPANN group archaeon]